MGIYWSTAAVLIAYFVLVWWIGTWLHLKGSDVWMLRGGLAFLGLLAAGIFLWFRHRLGAAASDGQQEAAPTDDIDLLVHDAMRQLKSSRLGRHASLDKLPLVYLIGESGSTKTTTIVHSSLDPELLAGQAHQDHEIVPTRTANIWYTPQAVFVDLSGSILSQPGRWTHLIRLLQPGRMASAFSKGQQAPRAAIVCFDCENFVQPGASGSVQSAARKLSSRLQEASQVLDISFPVYVLFTKIDRIPTFLDFARQLNKDEASEVLGTTLPVRPPQAVGVYAEEEHKRLTKAFEELFYSLAEKRTELLVREMEAEKLPGIYEFPRDLRKLRGLLVDFLVDLARPSHLRANPFLRGFYFTGVRPVMIDDVALAEPEPAAETAVNAGATRIFGGGAASVAARAPVPLRAVGSRKVPQWVFTTRLFNDVILKDRVALSASGTSTRVNLLRRILLVAVIAVALVASLGFLASFLGNRALESQVLDAANNVPSVQLSETQLASLPDLQRLDRLRQAVATLTSYDREGPPWRLRWGLYVGDALLPQARQLYFTRFREMLLAQTQQRLRELMRKAPDTPGPNDSYEYTYNALKAYLITSANNDKSTVDFLPPVLLTHWISGRDIDADRKNLARAQFEFYAAELPSGNPYPAPGNDSAEIGRTRTYLSRFGGIDLFYLPLLSSVSQKAPSLTFNEMFKDSAGVLNSSYRVKGAFTAAGFKIMQEELRHPANIGGEKWVLGDVAASQLDPSVLQQKLSQRYYEDFVNEWRNLFATSHVVKFQRHEAVPVLEKLSGPTSPMLELFWFVSHNTDVGVPEVSKPFAPVQAVEPPGPADRLPDQFVLPSNRDYVVALQRLGSDFNVALQSPQGLGDPAAAAQIRNSAGAARVVVAQVTGPNVDQRFHMENLVRQLLEEPILRVEELISQGSVDPLNAEGAALCQKFNAMAQKYPFNPRANDEVSLGELNAMLGPAGQLAAISTKLAPYLGTQDGVQANPTGPIHLSTPFVGFLRHATALSHTLYPEGSPTPRFTYRLGKLETDVSGLTIVIGGQSLSTADAFKTFTWTANEDVQVSANGAPYGSYAPPWAVFRFVSGATWTDSGLGTVNLLRNIESNGQPSRLPDGRIMYYRYQLQVTGLNPFRASEWSTLHCVGPVATAH
jgi:type VI secretion system protein ImpL